MARYKIDKEDMILAKVTEIHDRLVRIEKLLELGLPKSVKNAIAREKWEKEIAVIGLLPKDFNLATRPWIKK